MAKQTTKPEQTPVVNLNEGATSNDGANVADTAQTVKEAAAVPDKPEPKVYTSPRLDELKQIRRDLAAKLAGIEDVDSDEYNDANLAVYKAGNDIKAEIEALKKAERDQLALEARNARVALFDTAVDAKIAEQEHFRTVYSAITSPTKEDMEVMNGFTAAYKAAREVVVNELTAKFGSSTAAKPAGTPAAAGSGEVRGAKSKEILDYYVDQIATRPNDETAIRKELIEKGYNDGTIGNVIVTYKRANGLQK